MDKITIMNGKHTQMNNILSRLVLAGFIPAICVCFIACGVTAPPEKVTISYATPPYTVLADIAQAQGYFKLEGLEVTPHFHSTGKAALDEVLAGKADFATVAETPVMFAVMNGHKLAIIATIQSSRKTNAILAIKDSGINSPQDLKGKRIAATKGTISEYYLDAFLSTHGVAANKVNVVNLKPEEIKAALAQGDIDAASTFPPFLNESQEKLGDKGITFYEKEIYTQTFNLVAEQEYVRNHPAVIKKILLGLIEAEKFAIRDLATAQKVAAGFRQTDGAVLSSMWDSHTFRVSLDQSLILALEDESQWAIKNGLAKANEIPNYLNFIYFEGLKSVKPEAVRILR